MKTVTVNIVTPDGPVYDGEVTMVIAKTVAGDIGVLAGHVPMVAPLAISAVKLNKADGKSDVVTVSGGFVEVRPDKISILATAAELAENIDVARAKEAQKRAEARLQQKQSEIDVKRAEAALARAMNRIKVQEGNI
ncbi:F0F1 ATP synthase subunit epsilon [Caryophanon latum]|uniref:ATP synthase epsilon chain n=1 Tax=Caryophanon latum TaxID=33977 RepID=A0A1C0YDS5_9BACL|nr:F0F1 ATP synthase subunit epsilon [Caryophanon latum]OCS85263.1 F0F1 ATP synthase subunit epsilon [Caryophanon latum]